MSTTIGNDIEYDEDDSGETESPLHEPPAGGDEKGGGDALDSGDVDPFVGVEGASITASRAMPRSSFSEFGDKDMGTAFTDNPLHGMEQAQEDAGAAKPDKGDSGHEEVFPDLEDGGFMQENPLAAKTPSAASAAAASSASADVDNEAAKNRLAGFARVSSSGPASLSLGRKTQST